MILKKGFFNGNIERKFVSYMWTAIIMGAVISFSCGGLLVVFSFAGNLDAVTALSLFLCGWV